MHNLLSYAQLNGWRHFDDTLNELSDENDKLDDYFECIIDCDEMRSSSSCKRICKEILM
jgi:hypothetical protein